jgi:CRISPR-associated protein Cmr4
MDCAGGGSNHTDDCPVCYTFGHIKKSGGSEGQSGKVSVSDGRILLFPVHTLAGPVWLTSPTILRELDDNIELKELGDKVQLPQNLQKHDYLNLGWLMLSKADGVFALPAKIKHIPPEIQKRSVLVSDNLFGHIVNSNLEVRTSVSIDPETGAAKDGALFTYEAMPRATILWLDVVEDDFQKNGDKHPSWPVNKTSKQNNFPDNEEWQRPLDVVTSGLKLAELLGIGGMGTRGFGRVRLEAHWEVTK